MYGFLNLDKPLGLTSHDCVAKVRRLLRLKRVGHAGTLDPLASGVLPIAVGTATRLLQFLPTMKAYQARIRLGQVTTTDDLEGTVISTCAAPDLTLEQVQVALQTFVGNIQQVPPLFSAIQIDGQRLYKRAIAGEIPDIPARTVEVVSCEILHWYPGQFPELEVAICCGGGTYIRAIARDLGALLGCGGTLAGLIRTASSGFEQSSSLSFDTIESQLQQGTFHLLSVDHALAALPAVHLPPEAAYRWTLGQAIPWDAIDPTLPLGAFARLYEVGRGFLGIASIQHAALFDSGSGLQLQPKVVLAAPHRPDSGLDQNQSASK